MGRTEFPDPVETRALDPAEACLWLRRAMLERDLGLKEVASKIARSVGTVKRALRGSMGPRTAYRIFKEFGPGPE